MRPFNFFLLTFFFFHFGFSQENSFNLQKGYVAEGYDLVMIVEHHALDELVATCVRQPAQT